MEEQEGSYLNQLVKLTQSVREHGETLKQLKDVPELLKKLTSTSSAERKDNTPLDSSDVEEEENEQPFGIELEEVNNDKEGEIIDDELLEAFADVEKEVEYGPPLLSNVAEGIKTTVSRALSKETKTSLSSKFKIPENCKSVTVPKMNTEIWTNLPGKARVQDLNWQQAQASLSQGLIALSQIANNIAKRKSDVPQDLAKEILRICMDGANLVGNGFRNITQRRRVDQDYAGICNQDIPATEYLFGNDLKEALKSSKTASQVVKKGFMKNRVGYRHKPYERSRTSFSGTSTSGQSTLNRSRPSLLSQRRGGWNARNRNQNQWNKNYGFQNQ